MNKLEEYRDKLFPEEGEDSVYCDTSMLRRDGFDAALSLDLPVKFALWYDSKEQSWKDWRRTVYWIVGEEGVKQAYEYWVNKIYKIE